MLTLNEKKVLRLLLASFDNDYSINQIAKKCSLAPNGALKILKKFESEGILKSKTIGNVKAYKPDFSQDKTRLISELALMDKLQGNLKYRMQDLKEMKNLAKACIIFGSYITSKEPNDIDIFFIIDKKNYKPYQEALSNIKKIMPVRVHDVIQTEEDLKKNIGSNKIIPEIIKDGAILWGQDILTKVIMDAHKR